MIAGALVLLSGLLIGAVGIGGVVIVPTLTEVARIEIERAIAASLFAFLLTGIAAVIVNRGRLQTPVRDLALLNIAALVGAALGAALLDRLPVAAIKIFVAALATVSGLHALMGTHTHRA